MNDWFTQFRNMEPYFSMDEEQWQYAQDNFSKDEIKETLVEILMEYEPPYMEISEKECLNDYRKLKGVKWNDLYVEKKWFARSEYKWPFSNSLIRRLNVGNKASNFFQQHNRWSVDGTISPGPIRTWNSEKFMYTLLGSLFTLKVAKVNRSVLRTCISLRKYICSQFKPNVAKGIYDRYKCRNVLDFSAGWGDRLAGFYASDYGELYVGVDPKTENPPIYRQQAEFYEKHRTLFEGERKCEFINEPAEDADLSKYEGMMDIVFTSPPYFSVERYSHDVNASSKGKEKSNLQICDPMNDYIDGIIDSEYVECFGMEMAKRPNCIGIGNAKVTDETNRKEEFIIEKEGDAFAEPVWVWKKR